MPRLQRFALFLILPVLCFARPSFAANATFKIIDVSYGASNASETSHLVVVNATAKYVNGTDPADRHALIQTSVLDQSGGAVASSGKNYQGPFYSGQRITCAGSCGARKYITRPPCRNYIQANYSGRGKVVISRIWGSNEIDLAVGDAIQVPCRSSEPGWDGSYDPPGRLQLQIQSPEIIDGSGGGGGCGWAAVLQYVSLCDFNGCWTTSVYNWKRICI